MQIQGPAQLVFADGAAQQNLALVASGATGTVQYTVTEVPAQNVSVVKSAGASPLAIGAVLSAAEAGALLVTRSGTVSYGATVTAASIVGVRSRVYATGAAEPAFTAGDAAAVNAVKAGTFAVPSFPTGGAGTVTVDLLFDLGTPTVVGKMLETILHFGYANSICDLWTGVTAKALASTDGSAVTALSALGKAGSGTYPKNQNTLSGTITGAPSARWIGLRLEGVSPSVYPVVFKALGVQAATTTYTAMASPTYFAVSAQDSGAGGSATQRVAIGDSSTNFGSSTGNPVVYGDPGTRFPLGIVLPQPAAASYQLNVPAGLSLVEQVTGPTTVSSGSEFTATNATGPFAPAQTAGGATTQSLTITGTGKSYDGTHLVLSAGTYLDTPALGLTFPTTSDPATTQAPKGLRLNFTGVFPAGSHPLASVYAWSVGGLSLWSNWQAGRVFARIQRGSQYQDIDSDAVFSNTAQEDVSIRYTDTPGGTGTIAFFRGGVQVGATQVTNFKLRIPPEAPLECNIQGGNSSNSGPIKVKKVGLVVDVASQGVSYSPVASGTVTAAKLQSLYVDATSVSSPQSAKTVTYQGTGEPLRSIDVVVGPMPVSSGGNPVVYGDPGTRFALGISLPPTAAANYQLTVPTGLSLVEQVTTPTTVAAGSEFTATNATGPFAPAQTSGGATTQSLKITGTGATHDGTRLVLNSATYLDTPALGLVFPTTADPATNQAPKALRLNFTGIFPTTEHPLASVYVWSEGGLSLWSNWQAGRVMARIERNGQTQELGSDAGFSNTAQEDVSLRYTDTPGGTGTIAFFRGGVQHGATKVTNFKLRIPPEAPLECNVQGGNTGNSGPIKVRKVGLVVDLPSQSVSYSPVASGTVTAAKLQSLFVDATSVGSAQPAKTVTYQATTGGPVQSLDVVVGPMAVAAGAAFRAVLEDWSSGAAVSHANVLVMTKPARQNCRFEDSDWFDWQAPWTECLPQGPVPVINNIAYYCEAIRSGSYVQFQFGYDWTAAAMPANPFGDPTGKESYMVPHKWRIEDSSGALIARIERPDGGPLNGTDIPRIFSGSYDGSGAAITNATNKWYPHGTVRSGVVWRSGTPAAYPQATVTSRLPRFDVTVPYASHTDYSTNGGDMRLWSDGQANGFGNTRVMPWLPTNYAALVPTAGSSGDYYKTAGLYSAGSLAAVASTWLKYTPFNQAGRSPTTGPGGIRDDRTAIAEPVAQYMYNVAANRPHDGTPFASIALDYLTSYASEPFHCFEGGRCVPLFKGANANRVITLRNHYYGPGNSSTPADRAYYVQGGRTYEIASQFNPLRVRVPQKGTAADKPIFGTNQIDSSHAHQFPHWGSLLWQTPEFAFLGHKLWDQTRLYTNLIINEPSATSWADREGAWHFLHAVLAWKTASANSDRLYSRAEVMEFVRKDFEGFSDAHKAGFDNPPTNVLTNGAIDSRKVVYAGSKLFGVMYPVNDYHGQHDFFIGYWLTALGMGEKLGFNAALRAASAKAGAVLDWMIARHRQRIIGRISQAPRVNVVDNYLLVIWRNSAITAAGGNVASLPQTYAAVATQNGNAATWDKVVNADNTVSDRDGQALDQIIAGPSILKNQLGQTGADLDTAQSTAATWRTQKKNEQEALGANAGWSWFKFLNAVNNPAIS
jgi:hypothetical protein